MSCEQLQTDFQTANQAALDAYAAEESAAVAVEAANQAVVDCQAALDAAAADATQAEADYAASVTAADTASQEAGAAYVAYLECERDGGGTVEPEPEAFFLKTRRTVTRV